MVVGGAQTIGFAVGVGAALKMVTMLPRLVRMARAGGKAGIRAAKEVLRKLRKRFGDGCFVAGTLIAVAGGAAPIEDLRVGDRVLTYPGGQETQVDGTWRLVSLRMEDARTGGLLELETVQPPEWLVEHQAAPGREVWLSFGELGMGGWATVQAVEPAPTTAPGPSRVVLSTLRRYNEDVHELRFEETEEPLRPTGNHPLWSADRSAWDPASEV